MTDAPDQPAEYVTVEHAAERLRVSARMVNEYGRSDPPKLRTRKAGKRVLYHAGDVAQLAHDLNVASKPAPQKPLEMSVYEPGPFLDYLREKDQRITEKDQEIRRLNDDLKQAHQDIGRARVLIEQRQLLEEERNTLQKQLEDLQRSPWRKFLAKIGIK